MDLGSILLISGIAIFVIFLILRPLFEISADKKLITSSVPVNEMDQKRSILLAERDRVLRSLKEMEFDYSLGKIPQEDYPEQRAFLLRKGADIIKRLDELNGLATTDNLVERVEEAISEPSDTQIEVETTKGQSTDVDALIAARRREKSDKPAGFCPQCGRAVTSADKFCARCGNTLS